MKELYLKRLNEIKLMYFKADSFPDGIQPVWDKMDATIPSMKGRKFYGAAKMIEGKMEYRACVIPLDDNEHKTLGMEVFTIPGGAYAAKKLIDWQDHIPEIRNIFGELGSKFEGDGSRFLLEFYESMKELICMIPILEKEIDKF